jgi:hypothetical protein
MRIVIVGSVPAGTPAGRAHIETCGATSATGVGAGRIGLEMVEQLAGRGIAATPERWPR